MPQSPVVAAIQNPAQSLQRSSGRSRLSFKSVDGGTAIDALYQQGCCKVRFPQRTDGALEAVLLNTAGGLTDGDRVDNEVFWKDGSRATVTTQAAERIYRAAGDDSAKVNTRLRIEQACVACWLPQETIVFDGSRLARSLDIDMASGGSLLAHESIVFGRRAMGETVNVGRIEDSWRIRIDGRLVFADNFVVDERRTGPIDEYLGRRPVTDSARCLSTVVLVSNDCDRLVEHARALETSAHLRIGASCLGPVAILRVLAEDSQIMRKAFAQVFAGLGSTFGSELPRVWQC